MKPLIFTLLISFFLLLKLDAQSIRSVYINSPGTDDGFEYFEVLGSPGQSLANMYFIVIEGDAAGPGVIDQVKSLGALSLGANGLLLWRDGATVLVPAPDAATTVNVNDFSPDIENGSNTFMLVEATTAPTVGTDVDSNDDGVINTSGLPWTSVVDAVSIIENDGAANYGYADDFGFTNLGPFTGFNPDFIAFNAGIWYAGDVLGTNPGPYAVDAARNNIGPSLNTSLTPGRTGSALPVEMGFFKGVSKEKSILLNWETKSERNNEKFIIEKSADGVNFKETGEVAGAVYSDKTIQYSFEDNAPFKGLNFYRLKQVDIDKRVTYGSSISVQFQKMNELSANIFPNPASSDLIVSFNPIENESTIINVFNLSGQSILQKNVSPGMVSERLSLENLNSGTYQLRIKSGDSVQTISFQKQ
jgi:hypothetical protein